MPWMPASKALDESRQVREQVGTRRWGLLISKSGRGGGGGVSDGGARGRLDGCLELLVGLVPVLGLPSVVVLEP